jgi:hypothetical protein
MFNTKINRLYNTSPNVLRRIILDHTISSDNKSSQENTTQERLFVGGIRGELLELMCAARPAMEGTQRGGEGAKRKLSLSIVPHERGARLVGVVSLSGLHKIFLYLWCALGIGVPSLILLGSLTLAILTRRPVVFIMGTPLYLFGAIALYVSLNQMPKLAMQPVEEALDALGERISAEEKTSW